MNGRPIDKRDRIVRAILRSGARPGRLAGIVGESLTIRAFGLALGGVRLRVVRLVLMHDFAPHVLDLAKLADGAYALGMPVAVSGEGCSLFSGEDRYVVAPREVRALVERLCYLLTTEGTTGDAMLDRRPTVLAMIRGQSPRPR